MNKTATFNDAIIFLSKDSDPLFGSISYRNPANQNILSLLPVIHIKPLDYH